MGDYRPVLPALLQEALTDQRRGGLALGLPAMRQHLVYQAGPLGWQARQNIFEVSVRVMPIKTSTLNQAHHRRTALTDSQRTREQPVVSKRAVRAFFADDLTESTRVQ